MPPAICGSIEIGHPDECRLADAGTGREIESNCRLCIQRQCQSDQNYRATHTFFSSSSAQPVAHRLSGHGQELPVIMLH